MQNRMFNRNSYLKQQKKSNLNINKQKETHESYQFQQIKNRKLTNLNLNSPQQSKHIKKNQNIIEENIALEKKNQKSQIKFPQVKEKQLEGPYILKQVIGEGAFAKVKVGYRKIDDLKCVVKIFQKAKLIKQSRKTAIYKQIEILKQIKHPSIIEIIDHYQTAESICIVMQNFSNTSLADHCKQHRPLCQNKIKQITKQIAQALTYLHQKKVSHRDLKPQNILINSQDTIKIIDLGLAMIGDHQSMIIAGTPQYMCPQLIHKKNYNPFKADIWSFGIMLYWIVLGYFPQDNIQKKKKKLTNKQDLAYFDLKFPQDMHPGIQYILCKMLQTDPQLRIQASQILNNSWLKPRNFKTQISKLIKSLSNI